MTKRFYVCRQCRRFTMNKECVVCKSSKLSASWKGLVVINDATTSEIAQFLGVSVPGKYALFVG